MSQGYAEQEAEDLKELQKKTTYQISKPRSQNNRKSGRSRYIQVIGNKNIQHVKRAS